MPDSSGRFVGITVPAEAWERIFTPSCSNTGCAVRTDPSFLLRGVSQTTVLPTGRVAATGAP